MRPVAVEIFSMDGNHKKKRRKSLEIGLSWMFQGSACHFVSLFFMLSAKSSFQVNGKVFH